MNGWERSPDYGGPTPTRGGVAAIVAIIVIINATGICWLLFG
jgi:hypothetical protein